MKNLLLNADIEGGWHRETCRGQFGEIFVPDNFQVCFDEGLPVPHDPSNPNGYGRPEIHIINAEPPFLNPPRIQHGTKAIKAFTFYRIHRIYFYQTVVAEPGKIYRAGAWGHHWTSNKDDAKHSDQATEDDRRNATFTMGIDPYGPFGTKDLDPESVVWGEGAHIYDKYAPVPSVEVEAIGQHITWVVKSEVLWPLKHGDAYLDNFTLEEIEVTEPQPGECLGSPREQYPAVRWLLPKTATQANREDAVELIGQTEGTLCYSVDDAAQGNLTSRHINFLWYKKDSWTKEAHEAYLRTWYKGVTWQHIQRYPVLPPDPQDPPPGAPEHIIHYTNNLMGCQHQRTAQQWDTYLREAKPNLVKVLSVGHAVEAHRVNPDALIIWREHVDRSLEGQMIEGDRSANALAMLDRYSVKFDDHAAKQGIPVEDVVKRVKVLETFNEMIGTFNPVKLQKTQEFDIYFSEHLHSRYGQDLHAGLMTIAVGNPHESEYIDLLPVAKVCHDTGDYFTYHNYWTANRDRHYVVDRWVNFPGRQFEMDAVFTAHGYYPRYYGGESGALVSHDGWQLSSQNGWKDCGPFSYYMDQIELMNLRLLDWNRLNQGRYYGVALFVYGNYGWDRFAWEPGDMLELTERMRKYGIKED